MTERQEKIPIPKMIDPLFENEYMSRIITSRNKLINDLLEQLPLSEIAFRRGLEMRGQNFANDKVIWDEIRQEKGDPCKP